MSRDIFVMRQTWCVCCSESAMASIGECGSVLLGELQEKDTPWRRRLGMKEWQQRLFVAVSAVKKAQKFTFSRP